MPQRDGCRWGSPSGGCWSSGMWWRHSSRPSVTNRRRGNSLTPVTGKKTCCGKYAPELSVCMSSSLTSFCQCLTQPIPYCSQRSPWFTDRNASWPPCSVISWCSLSNHLPCASRSWLMSIYQSPLILRQERTLLWGKRQISGLKNPVCQKKLLLTSTRMFCCSTRRTYMATKFPLNSPVLEHAQVADISQQDSIPLNRFFKIGHACHNAHWMLSRSLSPPPEAVSGGGGGGACVSRRDQRLCQLEVLLLAGLTMLNRFWLRDQTKFSTPLMLAPSVQVDILVKVQAECPMTQWRGSHLLWPASSVIPSLTALWHGVPSLLYWQLRVQSGRNTVTLMPATREWKWPGLQHSRIKWARFGLLLPCSITSVWLGHIPSHYTGRPHPQGWWRNASLWGVKVGDWSATWWTVCHR